jgi:uncharacterized membrane protein YjjP (DUF1212 family)
VSPVPALDAAEELLCDVALALHRAGAPAHRLEDVVSSLAARLGVEVRIFSTPTSIYAGFGPPAAARTTLLRVQPGALDLGRLAEVDDVVKRLATGELAVDAAGDLLEAAATRGPRYPLAATLGSYGVASATVAMLFGASPTGVLAGAMTGVAVGAVVEAAARRSGAAPLAELLGAAMSGLLAGLLARMVPGVEAGLVSIAGVITLVPGLSLTTAMTELGTRHLASGTARLGGVLASFATLGLGAVAGASVWLWWPAPVPDASATAFLGASVAAALGPAAADLVWDLTAVGLALPAFAILMQARLRDLGAIAAAAVAGFAVSRALGGAVPAPFDATAGALTVGVVANALARLRDQPAAVALVPGLFLLVPGSVGFRSLVSLLSADVAGGLDDAVRAGLTAIGLAAGVIVANVALPPRRAL